jgi:hypothetical protein
VRATWRSGIAANGDLLLVAIRSVSFLERYIVIGMIRYKSERSDGR